MVGLRSSTPISKSSTLIDYEVGIGNQTNIVEIGERS